MTFPSSSAPLAGISRARLPAWALPDGWPTQANGEPQLADLAFRDGRIAAVTPSVEPAPGLWDLAGALTLPGLVEPMPIWTKPLPLNAAVRRRPGCWRRSTPCTRIASTGPGRIFNVGRPPRWPGRQQMV
ncbi:putative cytosine deaminase [Klebsiella variicola]|nr:putative cytosine deaminase [Klebsiella variicola]